ncbi:hypothetical protein OsJ_14557 [Oryza sativa Japonica Group]|uniref:Uncharacterized protein n=1 Tax=Oryza sativa subsp. japonica TaxID=39947 RepID=B9FEV3_ORYSJ|nr:hypothetical protein OsJ_14557 [Oryza sativa Japonica Group]
MARAELELAEREFARARAIWERAREEVERVERHEGDRRPPPRHRPRRRLRRPSRSPATPACSASTPS